MGALANDSCIVALGEDEDASQERRTESLLQRLETFAIDHFARGGKGIISRGSSDEVGVMGSLASGLGRFSKTGYKSSGKWRCTRCSWMNDPMSAQCTTCLFHSVKNVFRFKHRNSSECGSVVNALVFWLAL